MKRSLLTVVLLLGAAPTAAAAPFGEVPFRAVGEAATCLRATGYPGELVRSTRTGAQFLQAGTGGLTPVADVANGGSTSSCPEASARPSGAGVVAFATYSESGESSVRAALREPGGAWGTPAEVATLPRFFGGHPLAADVSDRGDAVVAYAGAGATDRNEIHVVRRAPGAPFGAAETVFTAGKSATGDVRVAAGVSASGESVVAWAFQPRSGKPRELWAAVATPGAAFAAPQRVGTLRTGGGFSLAVGAGGHTLLAFPSGNDLLVAERAPGATFGPAVRVGAATDPLVVYPTVAVRADGGAVVAWQGALDGDLQAVTRTQPGPFGAPVALAPKTALHYPKILLSLFEAFSDDSAASEVTSDGPSPDDSGSFPRSVITPDGRAFVTAAGIARRDGIWFGAPRVALVPLAGGPVETHVEGAELREGSAIAPLLSAAGTPAIAWTDNNDSDRDGRLHLALEGVPDGPDPAAPTVRLIGARRRVLEPTENLGFTVRCSAACDVRVQFAGGYLAPSDTVSLTRAGERKVKLSGIYGPLATLKGGPVELFLRYGAPGARRATAKTVTLNLRRLPDAPRPRVSDAVARRKGKAIVVTWRSDRDAKPSNFSVYATKTRDDPSDVVGSLFGGDIGDADVSGSGGRFSTQVDPSGGPRYVKIVSHVKDARKTDTTTVRVRG